MPRMLELCRKPKVAVPSHCPEPKSIPMQVDSLADDFLKRRGYFRISKECFEDTPDLVLAVLRDVLVTECQFRYDFMAFEYRGMSMHFGVCPDGLMAPTYCPQITRESMGHSVEWVLE